MKAKVLMSFKDRTNKKNYKKGDIIDLSVKRFNEITVKGGGRYIEAVEDEKTVKA